MVSMIAALYVDPAGCYADLPDIDLWDAARDARLYAGPHRVIAHPPCQRWGRYWHGSPNKPHQYRKGDDGGCFSAALESVRRFGGVLEHPAYSHAWMAHNLPWPGRGGWQQDISGGWCCQVDQGWYGHVSRKPTWLYAVGPAPPALIWGNAPRVPMPDYIVERWGYEKARRCGIVGLAGGKAKQRLRGATPPAFRDVLLNIARGETE
jgi:hypothetical protein